MKCSLDKRSWEKNYITVNAMETFWYKVNFAELQIKGSGPRSSWSSHLALRSIQNICTMNYDRRQSGRVPSISCLVITFVQTFVMSLWLRPS